MPVSVEPCSRSTEHRLPTKGRVKRRVKNSEKGGGNAKKKSGVDRGQNRNLGRRGGGVAKRASFWKDVRQQGLPGGQDKKTQFNQRGMRTDGGGKKGRKN